MNMNMVLPLANDEIWTNQTEISLQIVCTIFYEFGRIYQRYSLISNVEQIIETIARSIPAWALRFMKRTDLKIYVLMNMLGNEHKDHKTDLKSLLCLYRRKQFLVVSFVYISYVSNNMKWEKVFRFCLVFIPFSVSLSLRRSCKSHFNLVGLEVDLLLWFLLFIDFSFLLPHHRRYIFFPFLFFSFHFVWIYLFCGSIQYEKSMEKKSTNVKNQLIWFHQKSTQ